MTKKGNRYTVYLSGWVCEGSKYLFRIDNQEILDMIMDGEVPKKLLDSYLDKYPESFQTILNERIRSIFDDIIDEMAES